MECGRNINRETKIGRARKVREGRAIFLNANRFAIAIAYISVSIVIAIAIF